MKIIPAHDQNDFLCGQRHNLEFINIFNDDGTLNENGGPFKGMKRYDCRNAIIKKLTEMKLIKGKHPNKMVLQRCSKTGDIIEPMVKAQWWIDCKEDPNEKYCSVCNHERNACNSWWNYCPNCGAKMDGGAE